MGYGHNTVRLYATGIGHAEDVKAMVLPVLRLCDAQRAQRVTRRRPCDEWESFVQQHLLHNDDWDDPELEDTPHFFSYPQVELEQIPAWYRPDCTLWVLMPNCPLQARMGHGVESSGLIPDRVRGDACPNIVSFIFGPQDIVDYDLYEDDSKTRLVCRSMFSLSFSGPGDPADHMEFRRMVRELPVVKETQSALADIVGPTGVLVSWSI